MNAKIETNELILPVMPSDHVKDGLLLIDKDGKWIRGDVILGQMRYAIPEDFEAEDVYWKIEVEK